METRAGMPRCPFVLLSYVLLGLAAQAGAGLAQILLRSVSVGPRGGAVVRAEDSAALSAQVAFYYRPSARQQLRDFNLSLAPVSKDPAIAQVLHRPEPLQWSPQTLLLSDDDDDAADPPPGYRLAFHVSNLTLQGVFIGRTSVSFRPRLVPGAKAEPSEELQFQSPLPEEPPFPLAVTRSHWAKTMNAIFLSTLGCLIMVANAMMGAELKLSVVRETVMRPVAPTIGLACQFVAMPLLGWVLARCLLVPVGELSLALGLFVSGCVPGGGASNFWTVLLKGNADLSITMTFVSTVAALGLLPLWMWLLGSSFLPAAQLTVPYKNIVVSLAVLVGPILVGLAVNRWLPKVAALSRKVLRPFLIIILLFIVGFGSYANLYMFRLMSWRVVLGGLLLPFSGFWLGCFAALLSRQKAGDVAAIAIETGVQNSGIAIMLLKLSFPEPDGDIASVVPVVVSIFTPAPLLLGYSVHLLRTWLKARREGGLEMEEVAAKKALALESSDAAVLKAYAPSPAGPSTHALLVLADGPNGPLPDDDDDDDELSHSPSPDTSASD